MNGICHLEIPSKDFEKAKKFYSELFDWKFTEMKEMNYLMYEAPSGVGGGFDHSHDIASKPGFVFYIEVKDIEATIKKGEMLGGKTIKGKTQISPEYGYMALINDLEGNQIGLWSKK